MSFRSLFFLCAVLATVDLSPVEEDASEVGCVKCHHVDPKKLNIHLIPHSHDDVGWLKTYDQYYYGLNNSIQQASVQYIITSVVNALLQNPDRRFIQVETAFFWKWWKDQSPETRDKFKHLVDNGQIEMVNGAWSMNDEACANYQSTIDQFTWGLRLVDETVGTCGTPRIGWQIDPFGHSREHASLLTQMGYVGLFFARLDYADKLHRQEYAGYNFIWQASANLDKKFLFGGIFPTELYNPPTGFCFDILCGDDPLDDDPESPNYNIKHKVETFSKMMKESARFYKTNNIMIPMGSDFQYSAAEANYINIDRLIKAYKDHSELNVIYSTPSCYLKAVWDQRPKLPLKTDDFFPYSNDAHSYWTGYFTSRPNSKRFERIGHNILQATKQLYAMDTCYVANNNYTEDLKHLREAMGTLQHHDAVTGTEKQHVASDYVRLLNEGIRKAEKNIGQAVKNLLGLENITLDLSSCLLTNVSICNISQSSEKTLLLVYNPLAWNVSHYIRVPIANNSTIRLAGPNGAVDYDIVPTMSDFDFVKLAPWKPSRFELIFEAADLPPLGFKIYSLDQYGHVNNEVPPPPEKVLTFGWDENNFTIDATTNLLTSVSLNGITLSVKQNFFYYKSFTRELYEIRSKENYDNENDVVSGAYLFRPNGTEVYPLVSEVVNPKIFRGKFVQEFHQKWNDPTVDVTQVIRVYRGEGFIEFDWLVGDIDVGDNKTGKEVINKFTFPDIDNNNTFYTDSNGREMIKRVLNYRPDYTYNTTTEPVASNYYPITSKISIEDKMKEIGVSVLNDRSQGGTSLNKGEIELMIHRRIFRDDNKGVGEPLNETEFGDIGVYVRGSHYLVFGKSNGLNPDGLSTQAQERILAQKKLLQPWVGFARANHLENLDSLKNGSYSPLAAALPPNINILTFESWKGNSFILRLEHILEKGDDPNLSHSVKIDLKNIFTSSIKNFKEMNLGANTVKTDHHKHWLTEGNKLETFAPVQDSSATEIMLTPMQIRTFIIEFDSCDNTNSGSGLILQPIYFLCVFVIVTFLHI